MRKGSLLLIISVVLVSVDGRAQTAEWVNFTSAGGIYAIVDGGKDLWIATDGGLSRFDKSTGRSYVFNRSNANLPDNHIWSLAKDSSGNYWLGTQSNGVAKFNGVGCQAFNTKNSGLPHDQWNTGIAVDTAGRIWIGSSRYLSIYDGKSWKTYETGSPIYSYFAIRAVLFDTGGVTWIGASWGLGRFAGDTLSQQYAGISKEVYALAIDSSRSLWIGTSGDGLIKLQGESRTVFNAANSGIPDNRIFALKFDSKGRLWVGTGKGLARFDGTDWTVFNKENSGLDTDIVYALEIDNTGIIWLASRVDYIFRFDGQTWTKHKVGDSGVTGASLSSLAVEPNGSRWMTCWGSNRLTRFHGGEWQYFDSTNSHEMGKYLELLYSDSARQIWANADILISFTGSSSSRTSAIKNPQRGGRIKKDNRGNIWEASNHGLRKFDGSAWTEFNSANSPLPTDAIARVAIDGQDRIWISTMPAGDGSVGRLIRYDGSNWAMMYTCESRFDWISSIEIDSSGNVWIGILNSAAVGIDYGGGLRKYDGSSWQSYKMNNSSLPSNSVVDLCLDGRQVLWIGTYGGGLARFDRQNYWKVFESGNSGLPGNNVEFVAIDSLNNKWLGVQDCGLAVYREGGAILTAICVEEARNKASSFRLSQNYPNPFNPRTTIDFELTSDSPVTLEIFNVVGIKIRTMIRERKSDRGHHSVDWDGRDENGALVPSGVYFYQLRSSGQQTSRKMLMLR